LPEKAPNARFFNQLKKCYFEGYHITPGHSVELKSRQKISPEIIVHSAHFLANGPGFVEWSTYRHNMVVRLLKWVSSSTEVARGYPQFVQAA